MKPTWGSIWAHSSQQTVILNVFRKVDGQCGHHPVGYTFYTHANIYGMRYMASVSYRSASGSSYTKEVYEADYCLI